MESDAAKPKARDDLTVIGIDGELVVLDRRHKGLHHLNGSAAAVFTACDGTATFASMARALASTYGVSVERMQHDVAPLFDRLEEARLLQMPEDGCVDCGT
jgi:Coenzyme PQQ synthesis protein D (PqqD)